MEESDSGPLRTTSSISPSAVSDHPAEEDRLGFGPYVASIADFLTATATQPPLTLSVEGDWGTGKSSFMRQLQKELKSRKCVTVDFNAWRHDRSEELWTAFATHFLRSLSNSAGWWRRLSGSIQLWWKRLEVPAAIIPGLRSLLFLALTGWLVFVAATQLVPLSLDQATELLFSTDGNLNLPGLVGFVGSTGVALFLLFMLTKLHGSLGNPLAMRLDEYVKRPDYANHTSFLDDFHDDLALLIKCYSGGSRVYVFVDDLDRASVPKAADLMQAINLLISESSHLVFVLGMDRAKIAAGIGAKYAEYLPFLYGEGGSSDADRFRRARDFGYEFVEKFVQLPFRLPRPTESAILRMLGRESEDSPPPAASYTSVVEIVSGDDSDEVLDLAAMVAPLFDNNPRRVKQFLNAFRLNAHICAATGLFDYVDEGRSIWPLSIPRLAKFVALSLKWPLLVEELADSPELLTQIDQHVENPPKAGSATGRPLQRAEYWYRQDGLRELFSAEVARGVISSEMKYSLAHLDVRKLLETAPPAARSRVSDLEPGEYNVGTQSVSQSV